MSWDEKESSSTPTSIGSIEINLYDHDGTVSNMGASGVARVLDENGNVMSVKRVEDIRPFLTSAEKSALKNLMDKIRAKAEDKLLP